MFYPNNISRRDPHADKTTRAYMWYASIKSDVGLALTSFYPNSLITKLSKRFLLAWKYDIANQLFQAIVLHVALLQKYEPLWPKHAPGM